MARKPVQPRQKSAGEIAAYQMGLDSPPQANTRSRHARRREVRVSEDGSYILIETEIWEEETNW